MSKKNTKTSNKANNTKAKAEKEPVTETVKAEKPERVDTKGPHKAKAIAEARAAFKALGLNAPDFFDAVEDGTATEADYKALKVQTDALKIAVNSLGCHFQPAKEKAAKG